LPFSENDLRRAASNPFATRYTRPDVGEYLFPVGGSMDWLVARLRENRWWGQVTGPHGSGKSTLVYTLLPRLQAAGRRVEIYSLHAPVHGSRAARSCGSPVEPSAAAAGLPAECSRRAAADLPVACWRDSIASWNASTQIVVDGCEQLGWLQRTWLKWNCRRRGTGLLVTAHRDSGLPPLWTARTSVELAQRVVARLLGQGDAGWLRGEQVERLFAEHRGNVRELLFALYDLYEQRNAGGR
jgi:hypothetical protein